MSPVRELAQIGAVLGREFSYELLRAVSQLEDGPLQDGLKQLGAAEIVFPRGVPPEASYTFKHALLQDSAYASLLKSQRQHLHVRTAQVLEQQFGETVETHPEMLAYHYTEAGLIVRAVPYWQWAGQRANQHSAYAEAISHLTTGLALLTTLPDTPERSQHELPLQLALGTALMAAQGYAAPEVGQAFARARELCRQAADESPQLFPILWGLVAFYVVRSELHTARELAEQLLSLALGVQDPVFLMGAAFALGGVSVLLGELTRAREHLEQGIALHDPQQHRSLVSVFGEDVGISGLGWNAYALCGLGYSDQALKRVQEALTLAQDLSHPFSLTLTLYWAAILYQGRREGQAAQERAEAVITLSTEQEFPLWLAYGTTLRGWALAEQGQREEEIAQMRQGLMAFRATGAEFFRPVYLALLAEAYGKTGQVEEGLPVLAEALATVEKTGERFYEAELYRLKGTLTLQSKTSLGQVLDKSQASQNESENISTHHPNIAPKQRQKPKHGFSKPLILPASNKPNP